MSLVALLERFIMSCEKRILSRITYLREGGSKEGGREGGRGGRNELRQ